MDVPNDVLEFSSSDSDNTSRALLEGITSDSIAVGESRQFNLTENTARGSG